MLVRKQVILFERLFITVVFKSNRNPFPDISFAYLSSIPAVLEWVLVNPLSVNPTKWSNLLHLRPHFPVTFNQPLTPSVPSVVLFFWLNGWLRHIWCAILLNDNMDLNMSSLCTLVPEGPWCVFCATRSQVYWVLTDNMIFTGTLSWYYTQKHTQHT